MTARELIERVLRKLKNPTTQQNLGMDAYDLLDDLRLYLMELASLEQWSWLQVHMDPIAKTETGKRNYSLPRNFSDNFLRNASNGVDHLCLISDGTSEGFLEYEPATRFFSSDRVAASNGKPSSYTIQTNASGQKEIHLNPPPDSNSSSHYTIRGAYVMGFKNLHMDDEIPLEASGYLLYRLLMSQDPQSREYANAYQLARVQLYLTEARNQGTQVVPRMSGSEGSNSYEGAHYG
jgi:hypothetical protein